MSDYKLTVVDDKGVTRTYRCVGSTPTVTATQKTFTGHRVSPGTEETTDGSMTVNEAHVVDQKVEPWPSSGQ